MYFLFNGEYIRISPVKVILHFNVFKCLNILYISYGWKNLETKYFSYCLYVLCLKLSNTINYVSINHVIINLFFMIFNTYNGLKKNFC